VVACLQPPFQALQRLVGPRHGPGCQGSKAVLMGQRGTDTSSPSHPDLSENALIGSPGDNPKKQPTPNPGLQDAIRS